MSNQWYSYLTLSHRWPDGHDDNQPLLLMKNNIDEFQIEVSREKFEASRIFKEAARVTLALGHTYLWIDSLCIIQNSKEDWKRESERMAVIYGNSTCNLAFLHPMNFDIWRSRKRDPRSQNPCVLRAATPNSPGIFVRLMTGAMPGVEISGREISGYFARQKWPLFDRGWTLQEYVLSPRTLLLGGENLVWHCSQLFCDEIEGIIASASPEPSSISSMISRGRDMAKARYFPPVMKKVRSIKSLSETAALNFNVDWQNIVKEYRNRIFTDENDRTIAFAGIGRALQHFGNLTYLAGLWYEIFPLCLLWYVTRKDASRVRMENDLPNGDISSKVWTAEIEEPVKLPLPTWSWFSVPKYRFFYLDFIINAHVRYLRHSPDVQFDEIYWTRPKAFQFPSHDVRQFPQQSGFSQFEGLRVMLEMQRLPLTVNWPHDISQQLENISKHNPSTEDEDLAWELDFEVYMDSPLTKSPPREEAIYALVAEFQIVRPGNDFGIERRLSGLFLVPHSDSSTWRRIGAWKLNVQVKNVLVTSENMAEVGMRWRKYRIVSDIWETHDLTLV